MKKRYPIQLSLALLLCASRAIPAGVDTVTVAGPLSHISARAIVVLPDTYADSADSFAVVYLLHGWSGDYRNWYDKTDLGALADHYRLMIVCPDGGYAGWYIDSPVDTASRYATYIGREVVAFIDGHYRTRRSPGGRAICGLSMGGHGALYLLAAYPECFSMAGSMSGVVDLENSTQRYGIAALLGPFETSGDRWLAYSCISTVAHLAGKNHPILIDCGISDKFIDDNRNLHRIMIAAGIAHDYVERPGSHSWDYWTNALEYHIFFFVKHGLGAG